MEGEKNGETDGNSKILKDTQKERQNGRMREGWRDTHKYQNFKRHRKKERQNGRKREGWREIQKYQNFKRYRYGDSVCGGRVGNEKTVRSKAK